MIIGMVYTSAFQVYILYQKSDKQCTEAPATAGLKLQYEYQFNP